MHYIGGFDGGAKAAEKRTLYVKLRGGEVTCPDCGSVYSGAVVKLAAKTGSAIECRDGCKSLLDFGEPRQQK